MLITVTGLPRSGTAFVSMLLSLNPRCIAYHELAAYDRDWRNILATMNTIYPYVADCNTYGYLNHAEMKSDKRIWIMHNASKSHAASEIACRKKINPQLMIDLNRIGNQWANQNDCIAIAKDHIFTVDGCREIWSYCFASELFPIAKVEQLIKLNVQHHNAHIIFGEGKEFIL